MYHELHFGPVNGQTFNHFLASLTSIIHGYPAVLIMDNAPIHNNMAETYPDVQFRYLPPYSPFLNPIENMFSVLKNFIKQHLHAAAGAPVPVGLKTKFQHLLSERLCLSA